MKNLKFLALFFILPLFAFAAAHKFYVSVTHVDYIEDKQELQITSRLFIDDLEMILRKRYDETITLDDKKDLGKSDAYIEKYLTEKMVITLNGEEQQLSYLGKEYEDDIVICYLQASEIKDIKSFKISNKVLFDLYGEQQNIIRTKINSKNKSFILILGNDKAMLNFE